MCFTHTHTKKGFRLQIFILIQYFTCEMYLHFLRQKVYNLCQTFYHFKIKQLKYNTYTVKHPEKLAKWTMEKDFGALRRSVNYL